MNYPTPKEFKPTEQEREEIKNRLFANLAGTETFKAESLDLGIEALERLANIADRDTGQAVKVRKFLLGCYNGSRFPFDLTDFRSLDLEIYKDCILVLNMDKNPVCEVHEFFNEGSKMFEEWAKTVKDYN